MNPRTPLMLALLWTGLVGCSEPAPSEPCLGDEPVAVTLPFARLVRVSHEAQSDLELVRFEFDRSVAGTVTATAAEAAPGPYIEASSDAAVAPAGGRLTSVRIDGLIGGAATDRLRSDANDPYGIREVVQVADEAGPRWIVGTIESVCLRFRANVDAGLIVLSVTPG
jgi:hypothetical protein